MNDGDAGALGAHTINQLWRSGGWCAARAVSELRIARNGIDIDVGSALPGRWKRERRPRSVGDQRLCGQLARRALRAIVVYVEQHGCHRRGHQQRYERNCDQRSPSSGGRAVRHHVYPR